MSRCFPFPPPGYEKKARTDDVDVLKKVNLLSLCAFIAPNCYSVRYGHDFVIENKKEKRNNHSLGA